VFLLSFSLFVVSFIQHFDVTNEAQIQEPTDARQVRDELDDNAFLRACTCNEARSCVTCMSIEQKGDEPIVDGFDAKLMGLWNKLRSEPTNK
jgi:hypothetical protein